MERLDVSRMSRQVSKVQEKINQDKSKVSFELRLGEWILLACGLPLPLSFKAKAQNKYAQKKARMRWFRESTDLEKSTEISWQNH
jgi:hypothetical protein